MLCCPRSGFCTRFEVYQGKAANQEDYKEKCAGPQALLRNVQHLKNSKRVIYCDRYYTSISLFIQLLSLGLYVVGTTKTNVCGFPKSLLMKPKTEERGTIKILSTQILNLGFLLVYSWMDTKPVYMISTAYADHPTILKKRTVGGGKMNVNAILPILMYQNSMGGVDLNDFLRMSIYCIQSKIKFRKWYKMCFSAALDLVITNAYVLWNFIHKNSSTKLDHGQFMEKLAIQLLEYKFTSAILTRSSDVANTSTSLHSYHEYQIGEGYNGQYRSQKKCFVCSRSSKYYCTKCKVTICIKINKKNNMTCFDFIHTDEKTIGKVHRKLFTSQIKQNALTKHERRTKEREMKKKIKSRYNKSLSHSK